MTVSSTAKTYSSDQVMVLAAHQQIDSGRSESEFVTISPDAPSFTRKVGSDGEAVFSRSNNRTKTIKIKLQHTSLGNSILSQLLALSLSSPNGAGFPFEVLDLNNGATVTSAAFAIIAGPPEAPFGPEVGDREWTILTAATEDDFSGYPNATA